MIFKEFCFDEGFGGRMDIPYSQALNYYISANGNTTSRSIQIPGFAYNASCDGYPLTDQGYNNIPPSNSYTISWQPAPCNYVKFYFNTYNIYNEQVEFINATANNYTIYASQINDNHFWLEIDLCNGSRIVPRATPDVHGSFGSGFVIAESYNDFYNKIIYDKDQMPLLKNRSLFHRSDW